jgi:phage terminase large subunit-like protein
LKQADRYIKNVLSGKEVACEFVKLACRRHLADLEASKTDAFPFVYSAHQAQRVLNFFRLLRHTEGKLGGQPFNLQDNQAFALAMIFGWRQKSDGNRRFTQVYIEMARKGGKSQLGAGIELYCAGCEGEEGAQVYTAATTGDQAGIVFRAAKKMARYLQRDSPQMKSAIDIMAHSIIFKTTDSFIQKVSADHGTLDGLNPHCAVIDEYHAHKTDQVKGVMQTGMGSRDNPLLMIITTAGFDKEAPCFKVERRNAAGVLTGERKQENLWAAIYTLDPDDDWRDPKVWRKANPNLGSTPTEKYLHDQVQDAINKGTTTRVQVLTKNFNVWMDTPKIWIPEEDIKAVMRPLVLSEYEGRPCFVANDLAATVDITASARFFPPHGNKKAALFLKFWLSERGVERRKEDSNYRQWIDEGWMTVTPGNITDYAFLRKDVNEFAQNHSVGCVSYDPWNGYQLSTEFTGDGFETLLCRQSYAHMSEALRWIEQRILADEIDIDHNPVLLWMFRNIVLDYDSGDRIKPNKEKSADKIDGVSAAAMAVFSWMTAPPVVSSYLLDPEVPSAIGW